MLELSQLVDEIAALGVEARSRAERLHTQLQLAMRQAALSTEEWRALQERNGPGKAPWMTAECTGGPPGVVIPLPTAAPPHYTAIATDGSQIPMDRHAPTLCYLINVGEIVLHYGTAERPWLRSQAQVYFRDEDVYAHDSRGEAVPLSERIVANRRLLAESAALAGLIATHHTRHAVALVDDPLILWTPQGESEREQRVVVEQFCGMLTAAYQARVPVCGYVSRPGGKDVIGAIRASLCPEDCAHDPASPCSQMARLLDLSLYAALLDNPGDRSPVFASAARVLSLYPEEHRICFFYLNAGAEIARIEVPRWVAEDELLLAQAHVLCYDQARKGFGYPVALAEAHERAVVRGPERDAFFQLVESAFVREHVPAVITRKALAKRTRIL